MSTLMENYTLILLAIPIAIILALVLMVLIRLLASCFIYILILVTVGALVALGAYLLSVKPEEIPFGTNTSRIVYAVICFVLAFLIFLLMCCFRSRLQLASKIVEVAAVFVAGNCGIVLVPFIMFIVTILFIALWIL